MMFKTAGKYHFAILMIIALASFVCPACMSDSGDDDSEWDKSDGDSDSAEIAEEDGDNDYENSEETDSELWAMKFAIAYYCTLPPPFPPTAEFQLILTGVARLLVNQDGQDFNFQEDICDLSMDIIGDFGPLKLDIIFPQKAIDAVPTLPRYATLTSQEPGAVFHADSILDLYGLDQSKMDDPMYEDIHDLEAIIENDIPLDQIDDERVVDFEGDGIPGVTARLTGTVDGAVYVVFRMLRALDGELIKDGLIEGTIESSVEMITIGADSPIFEYQLDLQPYTVEELNRFEFIRLEDQSMSCENLYDHESELFSYNPMDYVDSLEESE